MASADAIRSHYDIGNEFYRLWLDDEMIYSGALWDGPDNASDPGSGPVDTLDRAQARKVDWFSDRLDLHPDASLLDIGCGWGGLLRRVVASGRCRQATGLTLSLEQAELATARLTAGDRAGAGGVVTFEVESWEDHRPPEPYDAVVSIGAFEHFAPPGLSTTERRARYAAFFAAAYDLLAPGRRLGLQTIALDNAVEDASSPVGTFFTGEIFPESSPPRIADVVETSDEWFSLRHVRIDPGHYARTCREWRRRLLANRSQAIALIGTERFAAYSKYLLLSEMQFSSGAATLGRFIFERRTHLLGRRPGRH
jgi:cyclopropane-fatty-acyl-phospholipid synthase